MDISKDTEQVTAQNPPLLQSEVRTADIQAIKVILHLTATIERFDALNKCNQNESNLLQRKVEEKDAIIAERDGTINSHLSTIVILTA